MKNKLLQYLQKFTDTEVIRIILIHMTTCCAYLLEFLKHW